MEDRIRTRVGYELVDDWTVKQIDRVVVNFVNESGGLFFVDSDNAVVTSVESSQEMLPYESRRTSHQNTLLRHGVFSLSERDSQLSLRLFHV